MSFNAGEACDVEHCHCSHDDDVKVSDDNVETAVTVEVGVTPQSPASETDAVQSNITEDSQAVLPEASETEHVAASACIDENVISLCDQISESFVSSELPAASMQGVATETCVVSSDDSVVDNSPESYSNDNEQEIIAEPSVSITEEDNCVTAEINFESNDDDNDDDDDGNNNECRNNPYGNDDLDVNSNEVISASSVIDDAAFVDCYSSSADFTSTVKELDEHHEAVFSTDVENSENTEHPTGLDNWRKTGSKLFSPVRHMSILDRKSRPVPLPRSNTFRLKSAGEMSTLVSSRKSIPVQYETCSSVHSKICQTMLIENEDQRDTGYSLPETCDSLGIYVDHKTVDEWPDHNVSASTTHDPEYDVFTELILTSSGDHNTMMPQDPGLRSYESEYDILKEDIWDDADCYDDLPDPQTEVVPLVGLPKEPTSDNTDAWYDTCESDGTYLQPVMTPSLPVDVCVVIMLLPMIICSE